MIIYTCPKCGGDLQFSVIDTYPPIHVTECPKCGWKEEKMDEIERVPYRTDVFDARFKISADAFEEAFAIDPGRNFGQKMIFPRL